VRKQEIEDKVCVKERKERGVRVHVKNGEREREREEGNERKKEGE